VKDHWLIRNLTYISTICQKHSLTKNFAIFRDKCIVETDFSLSQHHYHQTLEVSMSTIETLPATGLDPTMEALAQKAAAIASRMSDSSRDILFYVARGETERKIAEAVGISNLQSLKIRVVGLLKQFEFLDDLTVLDRNAIFLRTLEIVDGIT
jgi:hypothetical protein